MCLNSEMAILQSLSTRDGKDWGFPAKVVAKECLECPNTERQVWWEFAKCPPTLLPETQCMIL